MYQLIINTNTEKSGTTELDCWEDVDLGTATVALTYQANDLAELKSREVNRSNRIKLPRTARNNRLFGLPSDPLSATVAPYRYFDCRLYDNGVELFGAGAKLQLMDTTGTSYEVCIKGSMFDFFDKIKDLSLRDLDTATYLLKTGINLKYTSWNVNEVANTDISKDIVFPLMDWDTANNANLTYTQPGLPSNMFGDEETDSPIEGDARIHIEAKYIFPAVKLHRLVEAICKVQGYELELPINVDNPDDPDCLYRRAVVPVSSLALSDKDLDRIKNISAENKNSYRLASGEYFDITKGTYKNLRRDWGSRTVFIPKVSGTYTFYIETTPTQLPSNSYVRFVYGSKSDSIGGSVKLSMELNKTTTTVVAVELSVGDEFYFNIQNAGIGAVTMSSIKFFCAKFEGRESIFPADEFPVVANLPDITQLDLIKAVCQLYGLVMSIDDSNKRIETYTIDTVVDNINNGNFLDWSHKLDDTDHSSTYQWSSYGQKNYITYAEEEGKDGEKLQDRAYFTIDNHTLAAEKTLFELPFATCEETNVRGLAMAKIRMVEGGDSSPDSITESKPKLLCLKERDNVEVRFKDPESDNRSINRNITCIASFNSLSIEHFINSYYTTLSIQLLQRVRVLKEKLWLRPIDIQNFDHRMPIYFSKYNSCFYMNKINNYQPNKLTEVELVAILPNS